MAPASRSLAPIRKAIHRRREARENIRSAVGIPSIDAASVLLSSRACARSSSFRSSLEARSALARLPANLESTLRAPSRRATWVATPVPDVTRTRRSSGAALITTSRCRRSARTRSSEISAACGSSTAASPRRLSGVTAASSSAPRVPTASRRSFAVAYVFGVEPLQQVLLELPRGRLQSFTVAWDTRPESEGGQRWFHLYPDEDIAARRSTALDRPPQELEPHVRRVPLDATREGLRLRSGRLRHDLVRDRRLL